MLYPCLTLPGRCALAFSTLDMQSPMTLPLPPKNPGLPFFLSSLFIFRSAGLSSIQSTHSVPLKAWCPFPLTTKSLPLSCSPTTGSNLSHPLGLWLLLSHLPSGYFIYSHLFSSLNVDLQYCGVPPTFTIKKLNNSFLPQTLPSSKFKETPDTLNITAKEHLNFLPMPLCKFQQSVSSPLFLNTHQRSYQKTCSCETLSLRGVKTQSSGMKENAKLQEILCLFLCSYFKHHSECLACMR